MSFFNIFDGKFVEFCKKHQDFNFDSSQNPQPSTQGISNSASNPDQPSSTSTETGKVANAGKSLNSNSEEQASKDYNKFMVITGKNGIGKSRLLQLIREYIVTIKNENYPYMIVRRLDYGEHDDEYDPDKTDHPLVTENILETFNCNFIKWEETNAILKTTWEKLSIQNKVKEIKEQFFKNVYDESTLMNISEQEKNNNKILIDFHRIFFNYYLSRNEYDTDINSTNDHERKIYFDEFKKYFRRQMLKKICYGSLKQLLMLNMRYQFELDEINQLTGNEECESVTNKMVTKNKYGLKFPYRIEKNSKGFVDKSDVNERIIFTRISDKMKIRFKDLSPGERLILHLFLLIKDRENIKMKNIDGNIKQVLLLDEPDSHCEANLVDIFIDVIKIELVDEMNIQVIMTTHNYLTLSSTSVDGENIFVMKYDDNNNKMEIVVDKDKSFSYEILAKNIINLFSVNEQPIESVQQTYKSICSNENNEIISGTMYGCLLEDFIKRLLKDKNKRKDVISIMVGKPLKDSDIKKHHEVDYLSNFDCDKVDSGYHIVWPTSQNNPAWDLMIFENINSNKTIHLYQIKNSDDDDKFVETIQKHFNLVKIKIFEDLFKPTKSNTLDISTFECKFNFISFQSNQNDEFNNKVMNKKDEFLNKCNSFRNIFENFENYKTSHQNVQFKKIINALELLYPESIKFSGKRNSINLLSNINSENKIKEYLNDLAIIEKVFIDNIPHFDIFEDFETKTNDIMKNISQSQINITSRNRKKILTNIEYFKKLDQLVYSNFNFRLRLKFIEYDNNNYKDNFNFIDKSTLYKCDFLSLKKKVTNISKKPS